MSGGVLLVDADAAGSLAIVLRGLGRELLHASDGPRAIATIRAADPALVVLATEGAPELARAIRAELGPRAPRLLLVAGGEVRRVALVHFDDVVRRPFHATDLVARARRLLRASGVAPRLLVASRRASGQ